MNQNHIDLSNQICVVIITVNRAQSLLRTLQHLHNIPEKFPIIVVDNNSTDDTVALVKKNYPQVAVVTLAKNRGAVARNIGVQCTTTPYVAFCDDDSWWEAGALTKAVEYFEQYPDVGAIAGKILVKDDRRLDPTSALQSISPLTPYTNMPGPAILGFLGCGIIVRKKAFMGVQGYSKHIYFSGEEELLGIDLAAAGWGLTYCDDIVGRHYPAPRSNTAQRLRLSTRNRIQVAIMRRPWIKAVHIVSKLLSRASTDKNVALGILMGIIRIPISLKHRELVPWWVEQQIELLEDQNEQLAQKARHKQLQFAQSQTSSLESSSRELFS